MYDVTFPSQISPTCSLTLICPVVLYPTSDSCPILPNSYFIPLHSTFLLFPSPFLLAFIPLHSPSLLSSSTELLCSTLTSLSPSSPPLYFPTQFNAVFYPTLTLAHTLPETPPPSPILAVPLPCRALIYPTYAPLFIYSPLDDIYLAYSFTYSYIHPLINRFINLFIH